MAKAKMADDWFEDVARLHSYLLRHREDVDVAMSLERYVTDSAQPAEIRSVIVLMLGTASSQRRNAMAALLPRLEGETFIAAWYGLALRDLPVDSSVIELTAFWKGAVLYVGQDGVIAPTYRVLYKNRELGLPLDPDFQAATVEVHYPTEPFERQLGRVAEPACKASALSSVRLRPDPQTIKLAAQLLNKYDPEVSRLAKEIFARQDVSDPYSRAILVDMVRASQDPMGDLLWMYSLETNPELRSRILGELKQAAKPREVVDRVSQDLASRNLSEESAGRAIALLGSMNEPSVTVRLADIYSKAASETTRIQVARSLQGNPGDETTLADRVGLLGRILGDPSVAVRRCAVETIAGLPLPAGSRANILREHLDRESDPEIKALIQSRLDGK